MSDVLEYSIKHHVRARHIKIKINGLGKIQVVAPRGVGSGDIHHFVQSNTDWIVKTIDKLKDDRINHPNLGSQPPQTIALLSLSKKFSISYLPVVKKAQIEENNHELLVYTSSDDESVNLLRSWIQKKAKQILIPWLNEISSTHQIEFNKVSIRGQKTRWGSCSSKKNINLNRNLLFVQPELVNYLMVHELSHIIQPNHSKRFWSQVAQCEPNYRDLDRQLSQSHKTVPLWAYAQV